MEKENAYKLSIINKVIWEAMEKLIELNGYSDLTLHLEGSYYDIRDMVNDADNEPKKRYRVIDKISFFNFDNPNDISKILYRIKDVQENKKFFASESDLSYYSVR